MNIENKIIFYITDNGLKLSQRLKEFYPDIQILKFKQEMVSELWDKSRGIIFIMATGIVVRTIAPLIKNKKIDPAIVVIDEKGKFVISLLSGHVGGANRLAKEIADFLSGEAVITTASDVNNLPSPKNLVIGIGCNSKTSAVEIEDAVRNTLEKNNLSFLSIRSLATIDKKNDELGLITFARKYGFEITTFTPAELNIVNGVLKSEHVFKATGANAVAEPAAMLASGTNKLLIPKQKIGNVTIAVAEHRTQNLQGKIYIVGTGPGGIEHITPYAQDAIKNSHVIVGYNTYLNLISKMIEDKEVISTGMTEEVERCKKAVEIAMTGKTVSVISGGDPGIYAMAGLVFEILRGQESGVRGQESGVRGQGSEVRGQGSEVNGQHNFAPCPLPLAPTVEVIPGIAALNAAASRLGAPLMHDFATISLSDRLTPWELIEKRIDAATMADFVIILYNPKSKGRIEHVNKARDIILKYRSPQTPVGIVKNAMRDNEKIVITTLENMLDYDIDMQTTLMIGNSQTFIWKEWMITPRGYESKNR